MCSETAVSAAGPEATPAPGWWIRLRGSRTLRWLGGLAVLLLPGGILILALGAWLVERRRQPPTPNP
jgi:hypothetical protein